ncbi:MAG TPA: hypothetical protein VGN16_22925 [Acidobacteriaceae bacterium]|jgi:hypothetical protein
MPAITELTGGLAGAIGCDFRQSLNQLVFVEFGGKLSTYNLFPAATVVSSGTTTLKGTFLFDFDAGVQSAPGAPVGTTWDVFWDQATAVARSMDPAGTAKLLNLGVVPFGSITPSALQSLSYSTAKIVGNNDPTNKLVTGDVFAVHTNAGNYAKVLVVAYGYDIQIQWVTYRFAAAYNVIGTGYTNPEDVEVAADGVHAFVLEESGDLVKIALATANRSAPTTTVIANGIKMPQQMAIDEAHGNGYVVEYDPTGHGNLYRFGLAPLSAKHSVIATLNAATGLVISDDLQYAYVSEQNTGGTTGTVTRIGLADGSRHLVASGLIAPFHLTWADDGESALLVAERDPANRVSRIDLATGTSHIMIGGVATRPSSVALANPSQMLVCCDAHLQSVALVPFVTTGPLLMGIGFIPFDKISTATGLANTTVDPTYFYQVNNVPFGGTLPLMVNHQLAANDTAAYFRVLVYHGATLELVDTAPVTDEKWNGTQYTAVTTATTVIAGKPGYLPVHPVSDLFLWYNPSLGAFLDSTQLSNGLHNIVLEFITATGAPVATTSPLTILVDNNHCIAGITQPTLNGVSADPVCGVLKYTGFNALPVIMAYSGSHPNNFANYSFTLIKGVATLTPPSTHGPVSALVSPATATAATLLGKCTVAGFAEYIYVAATANNGWGSQTQYDASAAIAFVLAP